MPDPFCHRHTIRGLLLTLFSLFSSSQLSAGTFTYNPGSATWDTSTQNWLNSATPASWANTAADTAIFSGTGSTATIQAGGITAGSLNFQTTGYTIAGGSITLAGSANSSITVSTGATATISAALLNGFTKAGTGILFLANAASTNTGNIVVGAGTLKLGAAGQIADTASLTVLSGATFDLNGFNETLTLGNDAAATGTMTNSSATGATITIGTAGTAGVFHGNFTGNLTFVDSNAGDITFAGATASTNTGNATFNAATANTITFNNTSGANVFGGSLTITRGTVVLQQSEQISNTGSVTIDLGNSAQLNLNNQNETVGGITSANAGTNTAINLGSGTLTLGGNNSSSTFNGVIVGTGGLVKTGSATTTLGGTNTFSGGLTINAGAIAVASDAPLGATSGGVTINGATLQTTASFTTGRAFTFGASGGTFSVDPSTSLTLSSAASVSGTSAISKTGLGTLVLQATSGNPLGTGQFTLTSGALQFAPGGSGADIALAGANTAVGTRFLFAQGNTLALNKGSNNSLTLTLGNAGATTPGSASAGDLGRSGQGTLIIAPTALANLGSTERLFVNGGVFQVNGIVNPTVVAQDSNAQKPADFLAYSATNGLVVATYSDTNFTSSSATSVENITANTTLGGNKQVYALRIGTAQGRARWISMATR